MGISMTGGEDSEDQTICPTSLTSVLWNSKPLWPCSRKGRCSSIPRRSHTIKSVFKPTVTNNHDGKENFLRQKVPNIAADFVQGGNFRHQSLSNVRYNVLFGLFPERFQSLGGQPRIVVLILATEVGNPLVKSQNRPHF